MFLHDLKYEIIVNLRAKDLLLWLMLFPIVLGVLFKIAFGSIYENETLFSSIPAAIVMSGENEVFRSVIDSVSDGDSKLLEPTYAEEEEALSLLKSGNVSGIIYAGDSISLTVAGKGLRENILKSFIEQYSVYETMITDTINSDPTKLKAVISALSDDVSACTEIPVTQGNTDNMVQYFYNLIAMVAIFGSITGLHITENNQANMSALGARKNCSPTPKQVSLSAALIGSFAAQAVCMIVCVSFLAFVLKIDFGDRLPLVYLAAVTGGCMGVTMGFFTGSISALGKDAKVAINMSVSMTLCFLSGLMIGNIKAEIAQFAPWFNDVNPVAIISDSFYCLNLYSDYTRFTVKIVSMLIYMALFGILGIVLSRRKRYASI